MVTIKLFVIGVKRTELNIVEFTIYLECGMCFGNEYTSLLCLELVGIGFPLQLCGLCFVKSIHASPCFPFSNVRSLGVKTFEG